MKTTPNAATNAAPPVMTARSTSSVRAKRQKATDNPAITATATANATVVPRFPPTCVSHPPTS